MYRDFEPVLKDFCKDQDIVVGAPAVVFFVDEHVVLAGVPSLNQQIPRRVWVGLKRDKTGRGENHQIRIPQERGYHTVWLPKFGKVDFHDFKPVEGTTEWHIRTKLVEDLVNGLLARSIIKEFWKLNGIPLTVSILTDIRSGSGCNFSGSLSIALVTAIRLAAEQFGTVNDKHFSEEYLSKGPDGMWQLNWGGNAMGQLLDPHSDLHRVNRAALVLETYFHGGSASGYGTLCSLFPTKWPIIYMREGQSDDGVPGELDIEDWDNLNERDWQYIEKKLLDPELGLRYQLFPLDVTSVWPKPSPSSFPFSFGLIYSGRPKNTAQAIKKVRYLALELSKSLPEELSFLRDDAVTRWLGERAEPIGKGILDKMMEGQQSALEAMYSALVPAGFDVIHSVLQCFKLHNADPEAKEQALGSLAEAIWGAQGGLDQLRLVNSQARWLAGKLIEFLKDKQVNLYAMKYTGGSLGGYLLYVAPPETDLEEFQKVLDGCDILNDIRDIERPYCDYHSAFEEPDDKGLIITLPRASGEPERWEMICYVPKGEGWIKDKQMSTTVLPEWEWERIKAESEHNPMWCLLDLDFRNPKDYPDSQSRIFVKGRSLQEYRGTGKGEGPLAHAILVALNNGGACSKEDIQDHITDYFGPDAGAGYFDSKKKIRQHFLKEVEALLVWSSLFKPFRFDIHKPRGTYTLRVLPDSVDHVFIYFRHT